LLHKYIARLGAQLRGVSLQSVRAVLGTVGWWRKDWRAFRRADVILAVTLSLRDELRSHGVRAELLYPCTHGEPNVEHEPKPGAPVRLLTAAVSLDEPRKRVAWMLDALQPWSRVSCQLTLVGAASDSVRRRARALSIPVAFTGPLSRDEVVRTMREHDVFLFGSALDDWGYVLTEAVACGMAVVAPRLSPFDEILGDAGALYSADDPGAFLSALDGVLARVSDAKRACRARARDIFSRDAFVDALRRILAERFPQH
jgi:glycosyltransferase involved in cell wall biosynthesis